MRILNVPLVNENDVVVARQRARQIAALLGFDKHEHTRIATAVSEIARNAFTYATAGTVEFALEGVTSPQTMVVTISDRGTGIADVDAVLEGRSPSPSGMGIGLVGARRLMDQCDISTGRNQGTTICLKKLLPRTAPLITSMEISRIAEELIQHQQQDPWAEIQQQNHELLLTLAELRTRQEELERLNQELADTNRGVVALYAELDEKANSLRRADAVKTRFFSDMSHEFRTPVNSIHALVQILLDRTDGELTNEQEKQVTFIQKSAEHLGELIDDVLDLSKIEAGKVTVKPAEFAVRDLFSSLRGMVRPLLRTNEVVLHVVEPEAFPFLYSDEQKIAQILRNLLSNAIKFTVRGEIRLSATLIPSQDAVVFAVTDTGVGIAPADCEVIFHEFAQLDNPLQQRVKGTGLGLPLCRKLATLLGGHVTVESAVGVGSTFSLMLPLRYRADTESEEISICGVPLAEADSTRGPAVAARDARPRVLIIDNEEMSRYLVRQCIDTTTWRISEAETGPEGVRKAREEQPQVIFLDLQLPGMDGYGILAQLRADPLTTHIPVILNSTQLLSPQAGAWLRARATTIMAKSALSRQTVAALLHEARRQTAHFAGKE